MITNYLLSGFVFACLLFCASAYPSFQNELPNGGNVRNPCNSDEVWQGIGHLKQGGSGALNLFGIAFKNAGSTWTNSLCKDDSDGDGRSNGEELGDPNCVWSHGQTPERTTGITHPGFCEPLNSPACLKINGDVIKCSPKWSCPAINDTGVIVKEVRMTETSVPAEETSYFCQAFDVSSKNLEHTIATYPIVGNNEVLHHMIIYGCSQKPEESLFTKPQLCGMGVANCMNLIDLWGFGQPPGNCYPKEAGAPFGNEGYRYVMLQVHWNNPQKNSNWKDSSGFILYFSPTLRQHNTGVLMYGQSRLEIPAKKLDVSRNATCPSSCTKTLMKQAGYKIIWGTLHMHLLGSKGRVQQKRDGKVIRDLMPMMNYDYNTPDIVHYNPPVDMLPGDEIYTECHYNSEKKNDMTFYGDGTQDEMCFVFFQYYPHDLSTKGKWPNVDLCQQFDNVDLCSATLPGPEPYIVDGCNVKSIFNGKILEKHEIGLGKCKNPYGLVCTDECLLFVRDVLQKEPCLKGASGALLRRNTNNGWNHAHYRWLFIYMDTCLARMHKEKETSSNNTATTDLSSFGTVLIVMGVVAGVLLLCGTALLVVFLLKNAKKPTVFPMKQSSHL